MSDTPEFTEIGDDGKKVPATMDARAWAKEFVKTTARVPSVATDEGTMINWFASAIMAGYDTGFYRAVILKAEESEKVAAPAPVPAP